MAMTGGTAKLVSSGTPPGWPGPVSLYVYYKEESQSIETNKTVLSLGMYVTTPQSWHIGKWTDYYGSYIGTAASGENCRSFNGGIPEKTTGETWLVENQQFTIQHDDDGKKSVTIYWKWGVHSGWTGVINIPSGSFTVELTEIPRASILDSLVCDTGYFNGNLTFRYTPKSQAHYNRVVVVLNRNGIVTEIKTVNLGQKTASQQTGTITLSASELAEIYNRLPSVAKGVLRLTLLTYSDSGYSKQIGSAGYKELTLTIPNNSDTQAEITMSLAPVGSLPAAFAGLYIQGKTKVKATLEAQGKYGATIKAYSMKVGSSTYGSNNSYTSDYLTVSGSVTVQGYAEDSRGYTGSESQTIAVIAYDKPRIVDVEAVRCDAGGNPSDSGTYLKIKAKRSYAPVLSGGVQKNFCLIRYRYKSAAASSYSAWTTILARDNVAVDAVETGALLGGVLAATSTYLVQIQAVDDIGEYGETIITVPTDTVHNHKTKNGLGLGKYCEGENLLDVGWDAHFHGEVRIGDSGMTLREFILAVISEGG